MVAFLSILVAVALLGLTVYGLHKYQTMEVEYTVDRSMPLPPLEEGDNKSKDSNSPAEPPVAAAADKPRVAGKPARSNRARATPPADEPRHSQNWLEQVNALKAEEQLDQALQRCQQEFPLWGAYNQACIIVRSQLRQAPSASDSEESLLKQLFTLAATAELLHDKSPEAESLSLTQIRKLDLDSLDELDFPYQQIGYAHLRLIRKSDIRLMQARWGRPEQHALPRQHHQTHWQQLTAKLA